MVYFVGLEERDDGFLVLGERGVERETSWRKRERKRPLGGVCCYTSVHGRIETLAGGD
jgi:hypothetical protein